MKPDRDIFSDRMPPVVRVNVVLEGQRCADELILGMSRGAWRQRARVHWWSGGGGGFGKSFFVCQFLADPLAPSCFTVSV